MSKNITFVTHLRYDHEDRLNNLQTIINYYSTALPESKFIFVEDDFEHNKLFDSIKWHKKTAFYFLKNEKEYYRTRALNYGISKARTPVVISLDTDCIVDIKNILLCEEALLKGAVAAWPYNGYFIDVNFQAKKNFLHSNLQYDTLINELDNNYELPLSCSYKNIHIRCTSTDHLGVGGIVMFNREKFTSIGGYNQNFISWGCEDNEIKIRLNTLELPIFRTINKKDLCFHLYHRNAIRSENRFFQNNETLVKSIQNMKKAELIKYISKWNSFKQA